jgi:hypothetical protein
MKLGIGYFQHMETLVREQSRRNRILHINRHVQSLGGGGGGGEDDQRDTPY